MNRAVADAFRLGALNSASIVMNAAHVDEAVRLARENPALKVGVHLNVTRQRNQAPVAHPAQIPLLVDGDGRLRHGFVSLALLSFRRRLEAQRQVRVEMKAQIDKAVAAGIAPSHLDSHRHVHAIPALFEVVRELGREYGIPRVRVVNESFAATMRGSGVARSLFDGGAVKYLVLRALFRLGKAESGTYFYSILHTTRLYGKNMGRILVPKRYGAVEICTHPSVAAEDARAGDEAFGDYLLFSPDRQREFEALLDRDLPARVVRQQPG